MRSQLEFRENFIKINFTYALYPHLKIGIHLGTLKYREGKGASSGSL